MVFDRGGNEEMMSNPYTGDASQLDFPFLDDMNPVAPMDRVGSSKAVNTLTGGFKNAQYVPPYVYPDPFPGHKKGSVAGHDKTYWEGNYWEPDLRTETSGSGVIAPEDKLPPQKYPNTAPASWVKFIPPQANEDRLPTRFARYIDQVADRAEECSSPDCMAPCQAGDTVEVEIGNIVSPNAKLVGPSAEHMQGAVVDVSDDKGSEDCAPQGCTVMNPCVNAEKGTCVGWTVEATFDSGPEETLQQKAVCPAGFKPCKSFRMVVAAAALKKEGKECHLVVPTTTLAPQPPTTPPNATLPEPALDHTATTGYDSSGYRIGA